MICLNCRAEISIANQKFCTNCSFKLPSEDSHHNQTLCPNCRTEISIANQRFCTMCSFKLLSVELPHRQICPNCRTEISISNQKFCTNCSFKLPSVELPHRQICPNCRTEISISNQKFCPNCSFKLPSVELPHRQICPNCRKELSNSNQRFCTNCSFKLPFEPTERTSLKNEVRYNNKHGQLVWGYSSYKGMFQEYFRLTTVIFYLLIMLNYLFFNSLSQSSSFFSIMMLFMMISFIMNFFAFLFSKKHFSIKLTESNLLIRRSIVSIRKRIELSNIEKIEISLIKEKEFYKVKRRWRASINFDLKIITTNNSEKVYSFIRGFYVKAKTLGNNSSKKNEFISELYNLVNLFPNLIQFEDKSQLQKKKTFTWQNLMGLVFSMIFFTLIFSL